MTKVQRQVLTWVADAGGRLQIFCGYKTTRKGTVATTGVPCVATSLVVLPPLVKRGWLKHVDEDPRIGGWYELTDLGRAAIHPKGTPSSWPLRKTTGRLT